MGNVSEFVAVTIIDTTLDGLPGTFSNAKSIFKPLLSNAVMEGKPIQREDKLQFRASLIDCNNYYSRGCFAIYFSRLKTIVTTFWINTLTRRGKIRSHTVQYTGTPLYGHLLLRTVNTSSKSVKTDGKHMDKVRRIVHAKLRPFHFQIKTYYLSDANNPITR